MPETLSVTAGKDRPFFNASESASMTHSEPHPKQAYRILKWDQRHENHESRKIAGALQWIRVPTSQASMGLQRLLALPDGVAVFGIYILLAELAGTMPVRGTLADEHGPLTLRDLEIRIRVKASRIKRAIEVLCSPGIAWFTMDAPGISPGSCPGSSSGSSPASAVSLPEATASATPLESRSTGSEAGSATPPRPGETGAERDSKPRRDPASTPPHREKAGQENKNEKKKQQQAESSGNPGDVRDPVAAAEISHAADADKAGTDSVVSVRSELERLGVAEPALSRLCVIEGMTPKLVQHFAAQAKARSIANPVGLMITLIEQDAARLIAARRDADERAAKSKADAAAKQAEQAARDADLERRLKTLPTDFAELDRLKARYLERYPNAPAAMRNAFPHRSHALRIALLPIWEEEQAEKAGATETVAGGAR